MGARIFYWVYDRRKRQKSVGVLRRQRGKERKGAEGVKMPLLLPLPPLSCLVARRRADGAGSRHLWPFLKPPSPPLSCCLSVVAPLPRICPSIHTQLSSSSWLCSCYKVGFDLESFASLVFLFGRTGAGSTHAFAFAPPGAKTGPRNFDWRRPVRSFPVRLFPHLPGNPKQFGPKVARKASPHVLPEKLNQITAT